MSIEMIAKLYAASNKLNLEIFITFDLMDGPKDKPTLECRTGSIYIYKNFLLGHVTNVLYIGSKFLILIGQQTVYADS